MIKVLKIKFLVFKAKRAYALFAFTFLIQFLNAQINLIANPSFELNTGIPQNVYEISKCQSWYSAFQSPDYFSTFSPPTTTLGNCAVSIPINWAGNQKPKTGNFYSGIALAIPPASAGYPNFSINFELLGNKLTQPLLKDHIYDFKLHYSLADGSALINNQLSAYFSKTKYTADENTFILSNQSWYNTNINNINPQVNSDTTTFLNSDTINWNQFGGCFIASGGEEYLTIGNFRDNKFNNHIFLNSVFSPTCGYQQPLFEGYLYLDDVSLYDIGYYSGKAHCKNDTVICFNSSITVSNNIKDSSVIAWQPHSSLSCTNCPNPIAKPTATTKYYVTKTLCSFVTKDSITVTVITPSVLANAGISDTICVGKNTRIGTADSTYFTNYNWQPNIALSCFNCAMPYANPVSDITYTLQRSQCNISNSSTLSIRVEDCEPTYTIPTIFTPNGDGVNDTWGVNFSNTQYIKNFQLNIFNRWGTPILQTPNDSQNESVKPNFPAIKWDGHTTSGEVCADGVYFYIINFEINGEKKSFKGTVTLIR